MPDKQTFLNELVTLLNARFNQNEVESFCFQLGVDKENIAGDTKEAKIRNLIIFLERKRLLLKFIELGKKERQDIEWTVPFFLRVPELKKQLVDHEDDIEIIFNEVATCLKRLAEEEPNPRAEFIVQQVEKFLNDKMTADEFIIFWQEKLPNYTGFATSDAPKLNYEALAKRLQRGEIVLFLGLELLAALDQASPCPDKIIEQLAEEIQYKEFNGSFTEICEYWYLKSSEYSKEFLGERLEDLLKPATTAPMGVYQLLATITKPILLISANYDNFLENTLKQQGRRFAVISHTQEAEELGKLFISYSDKVDPCLITSEDLSKLQLLENGYTLIYKICGFFQESESLVLSERDYFNLAKTIDKFIPECIGRQLRKRGFWFLGHYPKNWQNRLIIQIMREKCKEQPLAIQKDTDTFSKAYWKAKHIDNHPLELGKFVENLREFF